ncbi:DciA family protein [Streptomyces sp. NPDC057496]|uniref:DciA family protein n=1 Tax=Streptomyces sp. NPDC057496 TaxID=3346149 RepID=UPI0036AD9F34
MTDSPLTTAPPLQSTTAPETSGADLARIALHQAREAARQRGAQARALRRPKRTLLQRDRRDPAGFATVLASLVVERAWDLPAAGGSVLDHWTAIASAVAPNLAAHAIAVAYDAEAGRLDLRPDSPAYGTQLRLFTARIITAANEQAGRTAVRSIRVLPAGTTAATTVPVGEHRPVPVPAPAPASPVKTRETASPGYRRTLDAHLAACARRDLGSKSGRA